MCSARGSARSSARGGQGGSQRRGWVRAGALAQECPPGEWSEYNGGSPSASSAVGDTRRGGDAPAFSSERAGVAGAAEVSAAAVAAAAAAAEVASKVGGAAVGGTVCGSSRLDGLCTHSPEAPVIKQEGTGASLFRNRTNVVTWLVGGESCSGTLILHQGHLDGHDFPHFRVGTDHFADLQF